MTYISSLRLEQNKRMARLYMKMHDKGMTYQQIADKFGITRSAVHQFIKRYYTPSE